jgi:intergrase/recombinase
MSHPNDVEHLPACQRAYAAFLNGDADLLRKELSAAIREHDDLIQDRARLEQRSGARLKEAAAILSRPEA